MERSTKGNWWESLMKIQIVTNCWSRSISESDNVWECLLKFLEGLGHHLSSLLDHRETQQVSVEFSLQLCGTSGQALREHVGHPALAHLTLDVLLLHHISLFEHKLSFWTTFHNSSQRGLTGTKASTRFTIISCKSKICLAWLQPSPIGSLASIY